MFVLRFSYNLIASIEPITVTKKPRRNDHGPTKTTAGSGYQDSRRGTAAKEQHPARQRKQAGKSRERQSAASFERGDCPGKRSSEGALSFQRFREDVPEIFPGRFSLFRNAMKSKIFPSAIFILTLLALGLSSCADKKMPSLTHPKPLTLPNPEVPMPQIPTPAEVPQPQTITAPNVTVPSTISPNSSPTSPAPDTPPSRFPE